MQSGNAGIPGGGVSYYSGDPSGVATAIFDAQQGSIVLDTTGGPPRLKTSPLGDNSGYSEVRTIQYTAYSPVTTASLTFNTLGNDEELYLTPAGTIAALTITFPTDAQSRIGQQIGFVSTQIVTALTLTLPGSVAINGVAPTSLAVNARYTFTKVAANTWLSSSNNSPVQTSSSILSTSPTAGVGYGTGAGSATVVQATNRTTGVAITTVSGSITTNNASLAAEAAATFVVTATGLIGVNDVVIVNQRSGSNGGNTDLEIVAVAANQFSIAVINNNASGGTAETGAIIINYIILRGVAS